MLELAALITVPAAVPPSPLPSSWASEVFTELPSSSSLALTITAWLAGRPARTRSVLATPSSCSCGGGSAVDADALAGLNRKSVVPTGSAGAASMPLQLTVRVAPVSPVAESETSQAHPRSVGQPTATQAL